MARHCRDKILQLAIMIQFVTFTLNHPAVRITLIMTRTLFDGNTASHTADLIDLSKKITQKQCNQLFSTVQQVSTVAL